MSLLENSVKIDLVFNRGHRQIHKARSGTRFGGNTAVRYSLGGSTLQWPICNILVNSILLLKYTPN